LILLLLSYYILWVVESLAHDHRHITQTGTKKRKRKRKRKRKKKRKIKRPDKVRQGYQGARP
jgi:hypothetical protein